MLRASGWWWALALVVARPAPDARAAVDRAVRALADAAHGSLWLQIVDADEVLLRRRTGYPRDTPVPIGSVRKWTTAALAMILVDEGVVRLDEPVGYWLPAWNEGDRRGITLRRLMSHTAGLVKRPRNGLCRGSHTLEACMDRLATVPLVAPPGAEFRYSSAGFHVAARVLEAASGVPFADLMQARLLDPLEMRDTSLRPAGPELEEMSGEMWTTPPDFTHFLQMILGDGVWRGRRILSVAATRELEAGQVGTARFVGAIPKRPWWDEGHEYYALGQWRNLGAPDGSTLVTTTEGMGWFVTWLDRRAGRAGCLALRQPDGAREPFRALVAATCTWSGARDCATTWGAGDELGAEDAPD